MVRVHTHFIEQHKQHDDTTRVACNIYDYDYDEYDEYDGDDDLTCGC